MHFLEQVASIMEHEHVSMYGDWMSPKTSLAHQMFGSKINRIQFKLDGL